MSLLQDTSIPVTSRGLRWSGINLRRAATAAPAPLIDVAQVRGILKVARARIILPHLARRSGRVHLWVPAQVVALPHPYAVRVPTRPQRAPRAAVRATRKARRVVEDVTPDRQRAALEFVNELALPVEVHEESAEEAGEDVVGEEDKKLLFKFESGWELPHHLRHRIEPLHEDGRALRLLTLRAMAAALQKLVAERAPVLCR